MITDPLSHWTHFWYEKAVAYLPANPMTHIQYSIFWNLVRRIFYNPIILASEISISQLNAFIAACVEKLTFDSLTEMTKNEALSNEAQRFQIIKTILQEYSDVILGPDQWLSKTVLGSDFYNHLADPVKVKDMNNRQKQFKQYKVNWLLFSRVFLFIIFLENWPPWSSGSCAQFPNTLRPAASFPTQDHLQSRKPRSHGSRAGLLLLVRQEVSRLLLIRLRGGKLCEIQRSWRVLPHSISRRHSRLQHLLSCFFSSLQKILQSRHKLRSIQQAFRTQNDKIRPEWNLRHTILD